MLFKQEEINLHTHSFYCGHGTGELKDFAEKARGVFKVLGFSEHQPVPDDSLPSRMPFSDFESYIADIENLQRENNRGFVIANENSYNLPNTDGNENGSEIFILKGSECDWEPRYRSFYEDYVLGEKAFDYVLGSVHFVKTKTGELKYIPSAREFDLNDLKWYVSRYAEMIESGLFLVACHPDLFFGGYKKWDEEAVSASKDIISCAIEHEIPLEMNDLGLRKRPMETNIGLRPQYTVPEFWALARDMGALICTNTDAHNPKDTCGSPENGFLNKSFCLASMLGIDFVRWEADLKTGKILYVKP